MELLPEGRDELVSNSFDLVQRRSDLPIFRRRSAALLVDAPLLQPQSDCKLERLSKSRGRGIPSSRYENDR
jgi:hypothetical protein